MKDFSTRRNKIRRWLKKQEVDCFLVSKGVNVTYLTGFTGDSSYLVITADKDLLVSDSRYTTQIEQECQGIQKEIRTSKTTTLKLLCSTLRKLKVQSVGLESHDISKLFYDQLSKEMADLELVDSHHVVEDFRAIKDQDEIAEIRKSIDLAERSFRVIRESLRGDQTESEIGNNLEHQIRLLGGDGCAFEPIVGVGERAALPHAVKTGKRIEESSLVLIDWGAKAGLYLSDLTRVLITGKPTAKMEKIYGIVLEAQRRAIAEIGPGVSVKKVDDAARNWISEAGFGSKFGHGLGHGLGLEIHESPFFSSISSAILKPGMVVTVEPGIYLPNWGGVRIEDDVLVTREGAEVLTSIPKSFDQARVLLP